MGGLCREGSRGCMEISAPSAQSCSEPETAVNNKRDEREREIGRGTV